MKNSSKLDEALDIIWTNKELKSINKNTAKQQIKDLMLELIGDALRTPGKKLVTDTTVDKKDPVQTYAWGVNTERARLCQKVEEL